MIFQTRKRNLVVNWVFSIIIILVVVLSEDLTLRIVLILLLLAYLITECFSKSIYSISFIDDEFVLFRIRDNFGLIDKTISYNQSDISYKYKTIPYRLGVRKQIDICYGNKLIGKINEHEVADTSLDQLVKYFELRGIASL
ncbi:hypothetical protein L3073_00065 [Ancylomarina sp. DW003]|nr:hypothetical protein [Ancylomarina sp. DW003]MDE5420596.1 hypothetical protein [Ancylomarina sp. DW003]